jgi:hypothetical protein
VPTERLLPGGQTLVGDRAGSVERGHIVAVVSDASHTVDPTACQKAVARMDGVIHIREFRWPDYDTLVAVWTQLAVTC